MKKFILITSRVLVMAACLAINSYHRAVAQSAPTGTVPRDFSTWNWEEPKFDQNRNVRIQYTNTWTANLSSGATTGLQPIDAPWANPNSAPLQAINFSSDYQKINGWELVRFDFGYSKALPVPYFVLYQKTTGILRIYAYLSASNYPNGVLFTLSHSDNDKTYPGHSPASLGTSQSLVVAPDKYLAQAAQSETLNYLASPGSNVGWTMGQFTLLLDPNVNNSSFNLSSYQIKIFGVQTSNVKLGGSFQFQTNDKDFAFSTTPNSVQQDNTGSLNITTNGQKFLGNISSFGSKLSDISSNAKKFRDLIDTSGTYKGPYKSLYDISTAVKNLADNKQLKAITSTAATLGSVFSLAGSIISLFADDADNSSAFVPTYSKGTITLDGTITTQSPLLTFYLLTPGSNHYRAGSSTTTTPQNLAQQLSYYNCPLGIFNIQNTPILEKISYKRAGVLHYNSAQYSSSDDILKYGAYISDSRDALYCNSYNLKYGNDIKPIINPQSGLEIVSVKFAIAQKFDLNVLAQPYQDVRYNFYGGSYSYDKARYYSFMYAQVASGALEAYPDDAGSGNGQDATVVIQTPFMEASCMGSRVTIPFNNGFATQTFDNPVFLRVIAELQPVGNPQAAHTYFSQDYAVDVQDSPYASNWAMPQGVAYTADATPPYTISSIYPSTGNYYEPAKVMYGNLTYDGNNKGEIANNTLLFATGSSARVQGFTSPNEPALFHAARSIGIAGELSVDVNNEFVISTDFKSVYPNPYAYYCDAQLGTGSYAVLNQACSYDPNATRLAGTQAISGNTTSTGLELEKLIISPNPANGSTMASLMVSDDECIQQAELLNLAGQISWQQRYECTQTLAANVPLRGLPTGLYIMRVATTKTIYTAKVSVE